MFHSVCRILLQDLLVSQRTNTESHQQDRMVREVSRNHTDRRLLQGNGGFGRTRGSASVSQTVAGKTGSELRDMT
jgi:hypothetical protein